MSHGDTWRKEMAHNVKEPQEGQAKGLRPDTRQQEHLLFGAPQRSLRAPRLSRGCSL